jgi:glutaredoxin-related protein
MKKKYFIIIFIVLASSVHAEKLATFHDFVRPNTLAVDNDQLYVTDFPTVYIFSLENFTLRKKFGKKGEGPREFLSWIPAIQVKDNHIIVNSVGKISYFSRNGEFIREVKAKLGRNFKPLGDKFVSYGYLSDNKVQYQTVNIYDSGLNKIKEIFREKFWNQFWEGKNMDVVNVKGFIFRIQDEKIIVNTEDGTLNIYDAEGNKVRTISHKYEKRAITAEDKEKYFEYYKVHPQYKTYYDIIKPRITFPSYFPPIRLFDAADSKIYVMTYREKDGKREFYIFDMEGKLLKHRYLPLKDLDVENPYPYTFKDGKLYQLMENDDEAWELHVTAID